MSVFRVKKGDKYFEEFFSYKNVKVFKINGRF